MRRGVLYGVLAGVLWGTIFIVPRQLADFSPLLLSAGRYVMYGLVSLVALAPMRRVWPRVRRADLVALVKLALTGNLLYYLLLSSAVHMVGIAPASLIVGVLPVTVTLIGRRDHGAVSLARLAWPLAMIAAGIVCINVDVFSVAGHAEQMARTGQAGAAGWQVLQSLRGVHAGVLTKLAGVGCALGALTCWTWYAVENARYLQRARHFSGNEWSVLWGVVTGALGALLWLGVMLLPAKVTGALGPLAPSVLSASSGRPSPDSLDPAGLAGSAGVPDFSGSADSSGSFGQADPSSLAGLLHAAAHAWHGLAGYLAHLPKLPESPESLADFLAAEPGAGGWRVVARQWAVECRGQTAAADAIRADDRVRDAVRAALRVRLRPPLAAPARNGRDRAAGRGRALVGAAAYG